MKRILFSTALAFALTLAAAPDAEAQAADYGAVGTIAGVVVIAGGALSLTSLGVTIADLVSFGGDTPFDDGCAALDLVVGFLSVGAAGAVLYYASIVEDPPPAYFAIGSGALALGALQISHGIWSLARTHARPRASAALIPTQDGAMLTIGGTF